MAERGLARNLPVFGWCAPIVGLALSTASPAVADLNPYGPPRPACPSLPPGSAPDPRDGPDLASPTALEKYPSASDSTGAALPGSVKRPIPAYGAGDAGTTARSVALWVPRIALSPLYFVSEFVMRRPLGAVANYAEQHYWPQRFLYYTSFGTYGTDHPIAIFPTVDFEWGVRANAGLAFSWDNALAQGNQIRASATAGGPDWLDLRLGDRVALDPRNTITLSGSIGRRADFQFWGLGPSSTSVGAYYRLLHTAAGFTYHTRSWRSSMFESEVGIRSAQFDNDVSNSPSVADAVASGELAAPPPGFEGYALGYQRVRAAVDTRPLRHPEGSKTATDFASPPGTGIRIDLHGEHAVDLSALRAVSSSVAGQWVRYGGGVGVYFDLTGQQRTIGFSVSTELADPIRGGEIPFTELPSLGGMEPMRALQQYRLMDRSYLAAKVGYRWPVWSGVDGVFDASLGNVFGAHYDGLEARLARGSFTMGVETTNARDLALQILFGLGTNTIKDGFGMESFRFVAGISNQF